MPGETTAATIALRGDLHTHTHYSDGAGTVLEMVAGAQELGLEYLAITDHSPRLRVANGLDRPRLERQWQELATVGRSTDVAVLRGIEVDILRDGSLDQAPDVLARTEVVVTSVHAGLDSDPAALTRRMVAAVANPHTLVLGHCTGRKRRVDGSWRPSSQFDAELVFAACAMFGVAVEVNARPDRDDPPDELVALAVESGCLFAIDSDAHAVEQLSFLTRGADRAASLGIPPERIINTWPLGQLLSHSQRRR